MCCSKVIKPVISQEPAVNLDFSSRIIVIKYIVSSAVPPSANWFLNGKPLNQAGRYSMEITPHGDGYIVVMTVNQVRPVYRVHSVKRTCHN